MSRRRHPGKLALLLRQMAAPLGLSLAMVALLGACAKSVKVNGQDVKDNKDRLRQGKGSAGSETPESTPPEEASVKNQPGTEPAPAEVPPTGKPEPVAVADGLAATRQYYQTRNTITLGVAAGMVHSGDSLELRNLSTGAVLVDHQTLALLQQGYTPGIGLMLAATDITLRLYPFEPSVRQGLRYGSNDLQVSVDSATPSYAQRTIYLRDFALFGNSPLAFGENRQRVGKLQGELSLYQKSAVKGTKALLTSGLLVPLNQ